MNDDTMGNWKTMGGGGDEEARGGHEAWTISDAVTEGGERDIVLAGRYKVVKRLGEGGMGSVWLAEDLKLDRKRFAIKMLPAVLAGKKVAYRQVKAEAMVAMKLSHSNIATVRAFEEDEGGNPFLVMDYIEGEGLDDILAERGPLSEEETVRLLRPVAAALDYAHSQGVVHRDVKPGNVMVRKDGTPFVLDFGIAREIQETLTRVTGKLSSGTLLYMSPEQLNGRSPKATQDVYSFAAMAYECLAGNPPFSRGQIEWQIVNNPPDPLPESVGKALREGVMAGLAKEASQRPAGCAEVLGKGLKVEGKRSKVRGDGVEENIESRRVGNEKVRRGHKEERGTEDVFLKEVQLEKALAGAEKVETATASEKEALGRVKGLFEAGKRAVRAGDKGAAGRLYQEVEVTLDSWKAGVEARRQEERAQKERVLEALLEAREMAMGDRKEQRGNEDAIRMRINTISHQTEDSGFEKKNEFSTSIWNWSMQILSVFALFGLVWGALLGHKAGFTVRGALAGVLTGGVLGYGIAWVVVGLRAVSRGLRRAFSRLGPSRDGP